MLEELRAAIEAEKERTGMTIDAQRKLLEQARDALTEWDALIKHQYTGTREGMSDMAYAAQHGNKTLSAITEHLKAHP